MNPLRPAPCRSLIAGMSACILLSLLGCSHTQKLPSEATPKSKPVTYRIRISSLATDPEMARLKSEVESTTGLKPRISSDLLTKDLLFHFDQNPGAKKGELEGLLHQSAIVCGFCRVGQTCSGYIYGALPGCLWGDNW